MSFILALSSKILFRLFRINFSSFNKIDVFESFISSLMEIMSIEPSFQFYSSFTSHITYPLIIILFSFGAYNLYAPVEWWLVWTIDWLLSSSFFFVCFSTCLKYNEPKNLKWPTLNFLLFQTLWGVLFINFFLEFYLWCELMLKSETSELYLRIYLYIIKKNILEQRDKSLSLSYNSKTYMVLFWKSFMIVATYL